MKTVPTFQKLDRRYVAGYLDGEECIRATLAKNKKNACGLHVFITNTHLPTLEVFEQQFGGKTSLRTKPNKKHRTQYQWRISSRKVIKNFLSFVLPYLREKKPQAELALQFCNLPILRANSFSTNWPKTLEARNKRIEIATKLRDLKKVDYSNDN